MALSARLSRDHINLIPDKFEALLAVIGSHQVTSSHWLWQTFTFDSVAMAFITPQPRLNTSSILKSTRDDVHSIQLVLFICVMLQIVMSPSARDFRAKRPTAPHCNVTTLRNSSTNWCGCEHLANYSEEIHGSHSIRLTLTKKLKLGRPKMKIWELWNVSFRF